MPTPFSLRPPPSTISSSSSSSSAFSPTDPRHAISLPCPRTHLFSLSFFLFYSSFSTVPRSALSTSTSARGRLFSPFRPRARFVVALFLPPLFLLLTLRSPPRDGGLSAPLSVMGQLFVYMARTGVSARYRAQDETESQDDTRDMQSLANPRYVTAIGYQSVKRSILKTDRTAALGTWNGEILAQISRGARLTLRVMKCNETKGKKFAVSRMFCES